MDLPEKIAALRKAQGLSQAELAERLYVTRQTVSRWETGAVTPDAENLLRLCQTLGVSADELLGNAPPPPCGEKPPQPPEGARRALFYFLALEGMLVLMQVLTVCVLESVFFGLLTCLPFACLVIGFEWAFRRQGGAQRTAAAAFRLRLYRITAWLGTYFPVRMAVMCFSAALSPAWGPLTFEAVTGALYVMTAVLLTARIDRGQSRRNTDPQQGEQEDR